MDTDIDSHCDGCGARIVGGRVGCQSLFEEYSGLALSDISLGRVHRLLVDTYCLQHLEPYCHSAKSYAAHLTQLCWAMHHGGAPHGYAAIQRWLNGETTLTKPSSLNALGTVTIAHVSQATSVSEHEHRVREWAADVWAAYRSQHGLAEQWVASALCSFKDSRASRR